MEMMTTFLLSDENTLLVIGECHFLKLHQLMGEFYFVAFVEMDIPLAIMLFFSKRAWWLLVGVAIGFALCRRCSAQRDTSSAWDVDIGFKCKEQSDAGNAFIDALKEFTQLLGAKVFCL